MSRSLDSVDCQTSVCLVILLHAAGWSLGPWAQRDGAGHRAQSAKEFWREFEFGLWPFQLFTFGDLGVSTLQSPVSSSPVSRSSRRLDVSTRLMNHVCRLSDVSPLVTRLSARASEFRSDDCRLSQRLNPHQRKGR